MKSPLPIQQVLVDLAVLCLWVPDMQFRRTPVLYLHGLNNIINAPNCPGIQPRMPRMHVAIALPDNLFECKVCGLSGSLDSLSEVACDPSKQAKLMELEPRLHYRVSHNISVVIFILILYLMRGIVL